MTYIGNVKWQHKNWAQQYKIDTQKFYNFFYLRNIALWRPPIVGTMKIGLF